MSGFYGDELVEVIGEAVLSFDEEAEATAEDEVCPLEAEASGEADAPMQDVGGVSGSSEVLGARPGEPVLAEPAVQPEAGEDDGGAVGSEREPQMLPRAAEPTELQRQQHMLSHLPYAAWCPLCVQARGRDAQHHTRQAVGPPLVCVDYLSIRLEQEEAAWVLVACTKPRGYGFGQLVRHKGAGDPLVQRAFLKWLEEAGLHGVLRLRSDAEPALKAFVDVVVASRRAPVMVETSPLDSPGSMGVVDVFCRDLAGMIRTLVAVLYEQWQVRVNVQHPMMCWTVRHACWLLNRFRER